MKRIKTIGIYALSIPVCILILWASMKDENVLYRLKGIFNDAT